LITAERERAAAKPMSDPRLGGSLPALIVVLFLFLVSPGLYPGEDTPPADPAAVIRSITAGWGYDTETADALADSAVFWLTADGKPFLESLWRELESAAETEHLSFVQARAAKKIN